MRNIFFPHYLSGEPKVVFRFIEKGSSYMGKDIDCPKPSYLKYISE